MNHKRRQAGFTLVELMAALLITAVIVGSSATILRLITAARTRLDTRVELDQNANAAITAITTALANGYRSRLDGDVLMEGVDHEDAALPSDRIRFQTVSMRRIRAGEPESDVREVEFFLAQPDLNVLPFLMRRTDPTRNDDRGGIVERVAGNVLGMNFVYFDGVGWLDAWPEGRREWPAAVRVELIVATAGTEAERGPKFTTATRLVTFPRRSKAQKAASAAAPAATSTSGSRRSSR